MQAIDLEYQKIQPDQGLSFELQRQGSMRSLIREKEIEASIFSPPETTRAWFRGRAVARFNHAISTIQWDEIEFRNGKRSRVVKLPEPAGDPRMGKLNELVDAENEFDGFFRALKET